MQWQLEGPALDSLLLEVEDTYEGRARILAAEKVRRGGIGGFFTREHFEVTVEVPDPDTDSDLEPGPPATNAVAPASEPLSVLDLADAVSDLDEHVTGAAADSRPKSTPPVTPKLSTDDATFHHVLTRLANLTQDGATPLPASGRPDIPEPRLAAWSPPTAPVPTSTCAPAPAPAPAEPVAAAAPSRHRLLPRTAPTVPASSSQRRRLAAYRLRRLGFPNQLLTDLSDEQDPDAALVQACEAIPVLPATTLRRGDVLVVLSGGRSGLDVARTAAGRLGVPADGVRHAAKVSVGSYPRVVTPEALARRRDAWASQPFPTILALDTDPAAEEWATAMLAAARPTTTWLCLPSTMKAADAVTLVQKRRPAAVVLTEVAQSASPATALGLGVPVAQLDDTPATPQVWRETLLPLLERLR